MEISQKAINDIANKILNTSLEIESEDLSVRLSAHNKITHSLKNSYNELSKKQDFFINGFNIYNNKLQEAISMGTFMRNISDHKKQKKIKNKEKEQEAKKAFKSAFKGFSAAQVKGIALAYQNAAGIFIKKGYEEIIKFKAEFTDQKLIYNFADTKTQKIIHLDEETFLETLSEGIYDPYASTISLGTNIEDTEPYYDFLKNFKAKVATLETLLAKRQEQLEKTQQTTIEISDLNMTVFRKITDYNKFEIKSARAFEIYTNIYYNDENLFNTLASNEQMSQSTQISLDKLINKLMPEGKGDTWAFFRVGDVWYKNGKELINIENKIAGSGLVNLGTIINTIKRIHQILNSGYANNPTKLKNKLIDFFTKQKRYKKASLDMFTDPVTEEVAEVIKRDIENTFSGYGGRNGAKLNIEQIKPAK